MTTETTLTETEIKDWAERIYQTEYLDTDLPKILREVQIYAEQDFDLVSWIMNRLPSCDDLPDEVYTALYEHVDAGIN